MSALKCPIHGAKLICPRCVGAKGGEITAGQLTKKQRSEKGKKAIAARWEKYREKKK